MYKHIDTICMIIFINIIYTYWCVRNVRMFWKCLHKFWAVATMREEWVLVEGLWRNKINFYFLYYVYFRIIWRIFKWASKDWVIFIRFPLASVSLIFHLSTNLRSLTFLFVYSGYRWCYLIIFSVNLKISMTIILSK